ncbi:sulfurtransferase [Wukongibacter sp. M2B1]|uniref:sulfurtransferase n=1 Tax=Wukongibacter sp. M2B1 TaxID=3088895 RepID=UPI003D794D19
MKFTSKVLVVLLILATVFAAVGCSSTSFNEDEAKSIISAKDALQLLGKENVVLVDAQKANIYGKAHVKGSVNISRDDIVVKEPVANVLGTKEQIEKVLGNVGISNDATVVIYDNNNNMDSARLWWTMKVYGHENVMVVSGGLKSLVEAGVEKTTEVPSVNPVEYSAKDKDISMIATIDEVKAQVNDPNENVVLIDTRSQEEYNAGTIPSSILIDYSDNNYNDGTYKSVQDIRIMYLENNIKPENTAIMYCKTSIRGAQTYLALYNAGYRNLKLFDGAWVEWVLDESNPKQMPSVNEVQSNEQDNS